MKFINNILNWGINLLLLSFIFIALWFFCQVFLFTSFRIPSDSMEPELIEGGRYPYLETDVRSKAFQPQCNTAVGASRDSQDSRTSKNQKE